MAFPTSMVETQLQRRIEGAVATVKSWDADVELLKACRLQIPFESLRNGSEADLSNHPKDIALPPTARFVQRFARFFKERMTWINQPPCQKCNQIENMEGVGTRGPRTADEVDGHASRVEVYVCRICKVETTFPRYNSVRKLLETHAGRCGEYANLFGLYCRAVGLETRYILDMTDHVWTEVRLLSDQASSVSSSDSDEPWWCMVDSCEGVIDETSMYEAGWGKKLSLIVAVSAVAVVDVTAKYTRKLHTPDFVVRRRGVSTSEDEIQTVLNNINRNLQRGLSDMDEKRVARSLSRELKLLESIRQESSWDNTKHHYRHGRISGSMDWKVSRQEDGNSGDGDEGTFGQKSQSVTTLRFHLEPFYPVRSPHSNASLEISVQPATDLYEKRHEAIIVNGVPCAFGRSCASMNVVVLDNIHLGCILQSLSFVSLREMTHFIETIPAHQIIAIVGRLPRTSAETETLESDQDFHCELGGFDEHCVDDGVLFIGQVLAKPDWAFCCSYKDALQGFRIHQVQPSLPPAAKVPPSVPLRRMKWVRGMRPSCVAGRLSESTMSLATQLVASFSQKQKAVQSFLETAEFKMYTSFGFSTKPGAPIYILNESAYPFKKCDDGWYTCLLLPGNIVSDDDDDIIDEENDSLRLCPCEIPVDTSFFVQALGSTLLSQDGALATVDALRNTRLVGLYFSAVWCGPCRSFTPMLAKVYQALKKSYPQQGLEIAFVSSDTNFTTFTSYFATMPWLAIPFDSIEPIKNVLSTTYKVRGIPSLVVLDSMTGQVLIDSDRSRQMVIDASKQGANAVNFMFRNTWLDLVAPENKQLLEILAASCYPIHSSTTDYFRFSSSPVLNKYIVRKQFIEKEKRMQTMISQLLDDDVDIKDAREAASTIERLNINSIPQLSLETGQLNDIMIKAENEILTKCSADWASEFLNIHGSVQLRVVLTISLKYLTNCLKSPWNEKFRQFSLSFKVADTIMQFKSGVQLLQSLGFQVCCGSDEFIAIIPIYSDLTNIRDRIKILLSSNDVA